MHASVLVYVGIVYLHLCVFGCFVLINWYIDVYCVIKAAL